ncbi:hypothetical protein ACFL0U_01845 [Pseudomonadota bacterium]
MKGLSKVILILAVVMIISSLITSLKGCGEKKTEPKKIKVIQKEEIQNEEDFLENALEIKEKIREEMGQEEDK